MQDWYLIQTKPNSELLASTHLTQQHYDVYMPLHKTLAKGRYGYQESIRPMFSRYLFVTLNELTDGWYSIKNTRGVSRMVRFGESPARVSQAVIDLLKSKEHASCEDPVVSHVKVGDAIRVCEGVFSGYEGLVTSLSAKERVTLLLKYAESYTRLTLPQKHVECIE